LVQDQVVMGVAHEVLDRLPVAVMGCDEEGMVVLINAEALRVFPEAQPGVCLNEVDGLSALAPWLNGPTTASALALQVQGQTWRVRYCTLGHQSQSRGGVLTFIPIGPDA
jgi:nitrogen fixation/metabolism regulation signal transduction histidine kinase